MSTSNLATISADARARLRDTARFFETTIAAPAGTTIHKLPHPNVSSTSLTVRRTDVDPAVAVASTAYTLDQRNGVIIFADPPSDSAGAIYLVYGYYYEWIADEDMQRYARVAFNEITYNMPSETATGQLDEVVYDVIVLGTIVEALYALLSEYSRDIDVHQPEGSTIPASQRYRMVSSMLAMWSEKFKEKAATLNLGIHKIEVFTMRRISRTTNRYVPIFLGQEVDDWTFPTRVWPPIDTQTLVLEEGDRE